MTPEQALMIVDPDTREAALAGAMGCRPLRDEYIAEACRVLAADYRELSKATAGLAGALARMTAERDAAVRDFTEYTQAWWNDEKRFPCEWCKHYDPPYCRNIKKLNSGGPCAGQFFEWRGPQPEEGAVWGERANMSASEEAGV